MDEEYTQEKTIDSIRVQLETARLEGTREFLRILILPPRIRDAALTVLLTTDFIGAYDTEVYNMTYHNFKMMLDIATLDEPDLGEYKKEDILQIFYEVNLLQNYYTIDLARNIFGFIPYEYQVM